MVLSSVWEGDDTSAPPIPVKGCAETPRTSVAAIGSAPIATPAAAIITPTAVAVATTPTAVAVATEPAQATVVAAQQRAEHQAAHAAERDLAPVVAAAQSTKPVQATEAALGGLWRRSDRQRGDRPDAQRHPQTGQNEEPGGTAARHAGQTACWACGACGACGGASVRAPQWGQKCSPGVSG